MRLPKLQLLHCDQQRPLNNLHHHMPISTPLSAPLPSTQTPKSPSIGLLFSHLLQEKIDYLLLFPSVSDGFWGLRLLFSVLLVIELECHAILEDDFLFEGVVGAEFGPVNKEVVLLLRDVQVQKHFHHFR